MRARTSSTMSVSVPTRQLGWLAYAGLAKLRAAGGYTSAKVLRVKITAAGRKVIAE
jgi:hypothetical protein